MSGAFAAMQIANSSLGMHQTWLDALAGNIANSNTAARTSDTAYQPRFVIARAMADGGVDVAGIALGDPKGIVVNNPESPLADADGNVRMPATDMNTQMTELIAAQRGYQASVQTTKTAQSTYDAALQIGKGA